MHTKDYMKFLAAVAVFGAVITGASSCGQSKKDKAAAQADSLKVQDVTVTKISALSFPAKPEAASTLPRMPESFFVKNNQNLTFL